MPVADPLCEALQYRLFKLIASYWLRCIERKLVMTTMKKITIRTQNCKSSGFHLPTVWVTPGNSTTLLLARPASMVSHTFFTVFHLSR